jgi:hypothetical protein
MRSRASGTVKVMADVPRNLEYDDPARCRGFLIILDADFACRLPDGHAGRHLDDYDGSGPYRLPAYTVTWEDDGQRMPPNA